VNGKNHTVDLTQRAFNAKLNTAERAALSAAMKQLMSHVKTGLVGLSTPTAQRAASSAAMQ
jgi:hypothetical protein